MRQKDVASPRRPSGAFCVRAAHGGARPVQLRCGTVSAALSAARVPVSARRRYSSGGGLRWRKRGGVRIQMAPCVAWTLLRMLPPSSSPASRLAGAGGRGGEGRAAMLAGAAAEGGLSLSLSRLPPPNKLPKRPRFSSGRFSSKRDDEASRSMGRAERGRGSGEGVFTLSAPPAEASGEASALCSALSLASCARARCRRSAGEPG